MRVDNAQVYGLAESLVRSGYPMRSKPYTAEQFRFECQLVDAMLHNGNAAGNDHVRRAAKLAAMREGGHDQFLAGIVVQFDLTAPLKMWTELERYRFITFVSSFSTMHRIGQMDVASCCNGRVSEATVAELARLQRLWQTCPPEREEEKREHYLNLLYNIPTGFELTAGLTTNYRCLKNVWAQRRTHRLPDWREFCQWVETLPLAAQLITGEEKTHG